MWTFFPAPKLSSSPFGATNLLASVDLNVTLKSLDIPIHCKHGWGNLLRWPLFLGLREWVNGTGTLRQ